MTSTQRPDRRRSARLAFDEEDAQQAAKRPKVDGAIASKAKQVHARINGASSKRAKPAYDEDDDGFKFSRTRSKTAKAKDPSPEAVVNGVQPAATINTKKRKHSASAPTDAHTAPRVRRSARLSGDKEALPAHEKDHLPAHEKDHSPAIDATRSKQREARVPTVNRVQQADIAGNKVTGVEQKPKAETQNHAEDQDPRAEHLPQVSKGTSSSELRVEKKRNPTKIPLPFADTPRIERNKEMRKGNAQGGVRRSSYGNRGRRASSLIDSGSSEAMPHEEVETAEFYKHIAQDLLEPRRMKHLLMWCGRRSLPEKPPPDTQDAMAVLAARVIQEELLKDFQTKSEMSDWFNREDTDPTVLVKKPNPRNIQNAAKLRELEQELQRLKDDKRAWDDLLRSTSSLYGSRKQAPESHEPSTTSAPEPTAIDASLLDPSQSAILASLSSFPDPSTAASAQTRLRAVADNLQFSVDCFADGLHKLESYRRQAERVADRLLGVAAERLEERSKDAAEVETEGDGDEDGRARRRYSVRDVLRGLSRVVGQ